MFVPNKPFGNLLEISPTTNIFLKTINSEYDEIIYGSQIKVVNY